jgi:5-formyltetrahydrofolate cyclo-ligase
MNKDLFRKHCLARLKLREKKSCQKKDKYIIEKLYALMQQINARTILLYIPIGIEVDIMPLIKRLRMEKRILYVPFMQGESFSLVKYRLPLKRKQFGIREPKYSRQYRIRSIDLAIVPIVGTDATLRRVGFGKGMYDRFFEREREIIKRTIFVSRLLCFCHHTVTDHYDVQADMIITPEKILLGKNSKRV